MGVFYDYRIREGSKEMTNKQVIEQLEGIKVYSKENINDDDPCDVWRRDVEALDIAISTLKYLIDHYELEEGDNFDT